MKVTKDLKKLGNVILTLFAIVFLSEIAINGFNFIGLAYAINRMSTILLAILIIFFIALVTLHTTIEVMNERDKS